MKIQIKNVTHRLGLSHFYFDVEITDSVVGISGLSGSGKTTFLNILCGLEKPMTGKIVFNNKLIFDSEAKVFVPPEKRDMAVVFQDHSLFPHLTVKENLLFSEKSRIDKTKEKFNKVVRMLCLENQLDKKPRYLSGGEKQRTAIGRALLSEPKLLLFDEPFSNLDRERKLRVVSYLSDINEHFDIPLLIISHDPEDISKLTDKHLIIEEGHIKSYG